MGYRIRVDELRRKRAAERNEDITYADIAKATGLNYRTVHRYATKRIARPDYLTLARLAQFFEVPVEALIDEGQGQKVAVVTA